MQSHGEIGNDLVNWTKKNCDMCKKKRNVSLKDYQIKCSTIEYKSRNLDAMQI